MKNTVSSRLYFEDGGEQYGFVVRMPNGEYLRDTRGNAPVMGTVVWNVERDAAGTVVANDYAAVFPTPETAEGVVRSLRTEARSVGVAQYDARIEKVDLEIQISFEPF